MSKVVNIIQHVFECLLVFIMTVGGVQTILFSGMDIVTTTAIGAALSNPWLIAAFGVVFALSGLLLMLSKFFRKNRWHQMALTIIFAGNLFGVLLEILILGIPAWNWIDNMVIAIIAGVIHFKRDRETPKVRSQRWLTRHARRSIL